MIVAAISDLHGCLPEIPPCDLLLIAGDICPNADSLLQAKWLDVAFRDWLNKIPARQIVAVAGNHDLIFERTAHLVPKGMRWQYLEDQMLDIDGLRIFGVPWIKPIWGAFNRSEESLERKYANIPDVDILISHGAPYGIGDLAPRRWYRFDENNETEWPAGEHTGSPSLRNRIFEIKPLLTVWGHIHEARGCWKYNDDTMVLANVSLMDAGFEAVHKPMLFKLDLQPRKIEVL